MLVGKALMSQPKNPSLQMHRLQFPIELYEAVAKAAAAEDENISAFIRRILAREVGWTGPTRNLTGYRGANSETP